MTADLSGSTAEPAILRAALELLEAMGWPIVPLFGVRADGRCFCSATDCKSQGKHPRFKAWPRLALRDAEAIRKHWQQFPYDNFGIPTGTASGVVVLDVDGAAGEVTLAGWVDRFGPLPACPTVITGRGRHLYFAAGSVPLHNRAGTAGRGLGEGLDLRGEGGFVVCAPSRHASGVDYAWAEGLRAGQVDPPAVLGWIVDAACERPSAVHPVSVAGVASPRVDHWASAALTREANTVRAAVEGSRNDTLNTAAFNLGTLVGGGALPASEVRGALLTAALDAGLGELEASKTISSGLRAGMSGNVRSAPVGGSNGHAAGSAGVTGGAGVREPAGPGVPDVSPLPSRMVPRFETRALFAPLPAQRWAVPGLQLGPGRPTLIVGYGASAKTWAGQAIAIAAAAGRPIFGHFECSPMVVLHIDYEQGFYATAKRYQRLVLGTGIDAAELGNRLQYIEMPRVYLDQKGGEEEYLRACEGVDLVILDALRGAAPFSDENDSGFRSVVDSLTRMSQRTGCSCIAIHHAGKPKKDGGDARTVARGSSAIYDAAGCVLNFVALPSGAKLVSQVKMPAEAEGQAVAAFELVVEDVSVDGVATAGARVCWQEHIPEDPAVKAASEFERHAALVMRVVSRVPAGQTSNEVVAQCGVSRSRALDVLHALADMGRLTVSKGPRNSKIYRIAEGS